MHQIVVMKIPMRIVRTRPLDPPPRVGAWTNCNPTARQAPPRPLQQRPMSLPSWARTKTDTKYMKKLAVPAPHSEIGWRSLPAFLRTRLSPQVDR